jgi:hypothetical protein
MNKYKTRKNNSLLICWLAMAGRRLLVSHGRTALGGTAELWLGTSNEETVRMTGRNQHQGRRMGAVLLTGER